MIWKTFKKSAKFYDIEQSNPILLGGCARIRGYITVWIIIKNIKNIIFNFRKFENQS